jgi:hypothetical protein
VIALSIAVTAFFLVVWGVAGLAVLVALRHSRRARTDSAAEWERNVRGVAPLKNWLSQAQLQSYESFGYFDVIGSDSGILYRIHHGQQANVEELDGFGQTVCAWCFVPVGDLVAGDVMLAQKVALETNERAAMSVAVRYAALRVRRTTRVRPPPLPASPLGVA